MKQESPDPYPSFILSVGESMDYKKVLLLRNLHMDFHNGNTDLHSHQHCKMGSFLYITVL